MTIIVTGKNGQIARDIKDYFGVFYQGHEIWYLGRDELDLTKKDDVATFFNSNSVDYVLHTSITGGRRTRKDTFEDYYQNIVMFDNILQHSGKFRWLINFDSMASFDRRLPMDYIEEVEVYKRLPKDFYGLSKNIINRLGRGHNFLNLRIFSCFGINEPTDRMIKGNILKCMNGDSVVIHQNRQMDFMYSVDVMKVVEHVLNNSPSSLPHRDYNLCYTEKIALFDIAQYIREITGHKGDLIVEDQQMGHPIIGNNTRLLEMNLSFCGLKAGIDEVYNQLKDSR